MTDSASIVAAATPNWVLPDIPAIFLLQGAVFTTECRGYERRALEESVPPA
jgi:hypothetical protein